MQKSEPISLKPQMKIPLSYGASLILIILAWTFYRALLIATDQHTSLYVDEAYYWVWAQTPDFGYFSKPPMIAWAIGISTFIFGDTDFGVKAIALIVYPLTAFVFYRLARQLSNSQTAFVCTLAFMSMPGVTLSSVIASTDVLLFFFWTLSLLAFVRALHTNNWQDWILLGIAGGLGMLTKYTMGVFAVSVLVYICCASEHRAQFKNPRLYLSALLALLIFSPNIFWNISHNFPTLQHTYEISRLENAGLHFDKLGAFLGGQFGIMGPVALGVFVVVLVMLALSLFSSKRKAVRADKNILLLLSFSLPFLAIISLQALMGRAHANWAAPTYVTATILIITYLLQAERKRLLTAVFAVNILFIVAIFHFHSLANIFGIELTRQSDPFKRAKGWDQFAANVETLLNQHPNTKLLSTSRTVLSHVAFYSQPHRFDGVAWNPKSQLRHHFDIVTNMAEHLGENFIYVTKNNADNLAGQFENLTLIKTINIPIHHDYALNYRAYLAEGFMGYIEQ